MKEARMSATVTLNVFSGRPNPRWILSDEQALDLRERIQREANPTAAAPPGLVRGLGYRGVEVRFDDSSEPVIIHGGVVGTHGAAPNLVDKDRAIEKYIVGGLPDNALAKEIADPVRAHVERDLATHIDIGQIGPIIFNPCPKNVAACAPPYEPAMWNFNPTQPNNNCYNYANDRVTNTFAQPGRYHNAMYTQLTCANVQPAAVADGLQAAANFSTAIADGF